ncbi:MAG TPA: hypothetical protein VJR89_07135 [Polyangiales bacterium]|nr:hypothetical protein [Polyangiales bacterium]
MTHYACAVLVLGALAAAGCGTAHMVVPSDIASSTEVVEVKDRSSWSGSLADESFKLGPYAITDVDRDWSSTRSTSLFGFASDRTKSGYAYHFKRGASDVSAECATESGGDEADLAFGIHATSSFAKLGCTCGEGVKVVVGAKTDKQYTGELTTRKATYQVSAIYEADGMLANGDPTGYRVDGETPLGAVEVVRPGRAYFKKGLDEAEHADLACLYAGLLLYEPPKEKEKH